MVTKTTDIIGQSLGIEVPTQPTKIATLLPPKKRDGNNDYEYARENLYSIIEKGQSALEDIVDIAKQSESARAFEVATNLMKTMVDANKDLLELAKKKKELEKEDVAAETHVTNNNLNITSADLLKMIKDNS